MTRILKGEKSTHSGENNENMLLLRSQNIGMFNMTELVVHNEMFVRVEFPL